MQALASSFNKGHDQQSAWDELAGGSNIPNTDPSIGSMANAIRFMASQNYGAHQVQEPDVQEEIIARNPQEARAHLRALHGQHEGAPMVVEHPQHPTEFTQLTLDQAMPQQVGHATQDISG